MAKRIFPKDVIPETAREWKTRKRRELRALRKAADAFLLGAAFTPVSEEFYPGMIDKIREFQKRLSVAKWGR